MAATKESTATEPDAVPTLNTERFEEIERHISHLLNTREHAQNCPIDHGPEING